jgi:outer membrane immunogenic protein
MKRLLAGAALLGTAVSAQAADLAVKAPYYKAPVLAVYDWTGFYFGGNVGVGLARNRTEQSFPGNTFDLTYLQPQGFIGGGQVGYNWQTNSSFLGLGPMVFGVEADIQGADMTDRRTALNGLAGINTTYDQRLGWFGTVRGRVGITTGPVLTYVTAGYAYGNVRTTTTETAGAVTGVLNTDRMQDGYVIGSGVEAALGGNWTGKIEYLYLNLGNRNDGFTLFGTPQNLNSQIRENIFRIGLNYRIGGNFGSGTGRDRSSLAIAGLTDTFNLAPDGILGGGQIGYNWQAASWVFGLEADFQASSQRDNRTCVATCTVAFAAAYDARLPWFGTARGRLGYSVGSTLFYATGGYAYGSVKTDITTNVLGNLTDNSFRSNRSGYTVGGGIETPFTFLGLFGPNWTTKAEYLYVDLGRATDTFTNNGVTFTNSTKVTEHIFRTGINYHFNSPVVAKY